MSMLIDEASVFMRIHISHYTISSHICNLKTNPDHQLSERYERSEGS